MLGSRSWSLCSGRHRRGSLDPRLVKEQGGDGKPEDDRQGSDDLPPLIDLLQFLRDLRLLHDRGSLQDMEVVIFIPRDALPPHDQNQDGNREHAPNTNQRDEIHVHTSSPAYSRISGLFRSPGSAAPPSVVRSNGRHVASSMASTTSSRYAS